MESRAKYDARKIYCALKFFERMKEFTEMARGVNALRADDTSLQLNFVQMDLNRFRHCIRSILERNIAVYLHTSTLEAA